MGTPSRFPLSVFFILTFFFNFYSFTFFSFSHFFQPFFLSTFTFITELSIWRFFHSVSWNSFGRLCLCASLWCPYPLLWVRNRLNFFSENLVFNIFTKNLPLLLGLVLFSSHFSGLSYLILSVVRFFDCLYEYNCVTPSWLNLCVNLSDRQILKDDQKDCQSAVHIRS